MCKQGTIQQLFAAAALQSQQWHYHSTLKRWFHQSIPAELDGQVLNLVHPSHSFLLPYA
jgi:CCR4-NOT transcriptional regulation complex NOT5 subunit